MKIVFRTTGVLILACLVSLPVAQAQKLQSTPVDLSDFWNADGWQNNVAGSDPTVGTNHPSSPGSIWTLDNGDQRVLVNTIPAEIKPGQVNVTEDGEVAFLLPQMNVGELDVYYAAGDTIPVPPGKYKYVFFACMSGNGNWPGGEGDWSPIVDIDTKKVIDQRAELNSFKPVYQEGAGDWIYMGIVNDWFWKVPEWVAPESGNPDEVLLEFLTYDGDPDDVLYLWDYVGMSNHDYGQYHYVNGAGNYFTYILDTIPVGTKEATLWTEMWGNVKLSISNKTSDDADFTVLYDSSKEDKVYTAPAGNIDGYQPNRSLRSFDLAPYLNDGTVTTIYLKYEDAAPDNAVEQENNPWGARSRHIGIFTGKTKVSKLGARLWPGLKRTDNNAPEGGLILIKKKYVLDDTKTLTSLVMPNNIPRGDPILSIFGITLANEGTAVENFMLY